jgi:hypothetical protein
MRVGGAPAVPRGYRIRSPTGYIHASTKGL